jgi:hypothetical protein
MKQTVEIEGAIYDRLQRLIDEANEPWLTVETCVELAVTAWLDGAEGKA